MPAKRRILITLFLVVSIAVALAMIALNLTTATERKARWLRSEIEQSLPIGSERNEIDDFLKLRKIEPHHYVHRVEGSIKDIPTGLWCMKGHVQVIFYLDEGDELTSFQVKTAYTGPF